MVVPFASLATRQTPEYDATLRAGAVLGASRRCLDGASSFAAAPGGDALYGCNSLEWNDHSASLRLALHPHNRTLHPVQLRNLGP